MAETQKSVLVFYPHNFYEMTAGTHRRIHDLLGYFRRRGFGVDLLSVNGFTNSWGKEDLARGDLFDSVRVCDWKPSVKEKLGWGWALKEGGLPDFAISPLKKLFREMASSRTYSAIVISYVYWAGLIDQARGDSLRVINVQDFITLYEFMKRGKREFTLGRMFEDEVRSISKFEYALSISEEETLTLAPFCPGTRFINVPVSFAPRFSPEGGEYLYDILFVGSDNPFNREGMRWFMEEVHPLLPPDVRIAVVGLVCDHVEKRGNVTLMRHVPDLDDVYGKSRLTICPLKGGTGLKVKVVESLSYGIPVVTTAQGLAGILQKEENGCLLADTPGAFAEGVLTLLKDSREYRRLKKQAEEFFLKKFSMERWEGALDRVFLPEKLKKGFTAGLTR